MVNKKVILIGLSVVVITGLLLSGTIMSQVDEPKFKVEEASGDIEIRAYEPMILAQVTIDGVRKEAIREGFLLIADYIFGNNLSVEEALFVEEDVSSAKGQKIAMTAPVLQQPHDAHKTEKVSDDGEKSNSWLVSFVMPNTHTLDTLPKPLNPHVKLISVPAKRFVVIRFSGLAEDSSIDDKIERLKAYVSTHKLKTKGAPLYAFYNPPWTLPILRRNEVLLELSE